MKLFWGKLHKADGQASATLSGPANDGQRQRKAKPKREKRRVSARGAVMLLGVSMLATGIVFSGLVLAVADRYQQVQDRSSALIAALHQQGSADNLRSALYGAVYRAVYAGLAFDSPGVTAVQQEAEANGKTFIEALAALSGDNLPDDVLGVVSALNSPLKSFVGQTNSLIGYVAKGQIDAARMRLKSYDGVFAQLQTKMADLAATIEAAQTSLSAEVAAVQNLTRAVIGGGMVLLVLIAAATVLIWTRLFVRPLGKMTDAFQRLGAGDLDVETSHKLPIREMHRLGAVLVDFRAALVERQRLAAEAEEGAALTRARLDEAARLNNDVAHVAAAALRGDFTGRVAGDYAEAELRDMAMTVNGLVETVERSITETADVLSALAQADLTRRMTGDYQGSLKTLADDVNAVGDRLTWLVRDLKETSAALKTATSEILAGSNDLSDRTTRQAATIEETSASMEQLAGTVVENAKRAEEASAGAADVSATAVAGGEVMERATGAMVRISESSSKISNIIGLIDDIAFQTNLLALNASVEAARAGDAGRGFAVVASEVRRLAQSAAGASKEVKGLIEESTQEVKAGTALVHDAAGRLDAIRKGTQSTARLFDEIAKANRMQALSIDEMTVAVRTLDEMTQHNAALVEETNAAIEQTERRAHDLDQMVALFRLDAARETEAPALRGAA